MSPLNDSSSTVTLSGRQLALKRREAMALRGKAAIPAGAHGASKSGEGGGRATLATAPSTGGAGVTTLAMKSAGSTLSAGAEPVVVAVNPQRRAARARREALSQQGKAAIGTATSRPSGRTKPVVAAVRTEPAGDCGCGCNGGGACTPSVSALLNPLERTATAPQEAAGAKPQDTSGRALARARRTALAQSGKAGLKRVAQAVKLASSMPSQDWQAALAHGVTGRQSAMQRRIVQSYKGKDSGSSTSNASVRPTGRVRPSVSKPAAAQQATPSSGEVSGVRDAKVTGNEPHSYGWVTGAAYLSAPKPDASPLTRPAVAGGASVSPRPLAAGHVTGAPVTNPSKFTGDESGACRVVTGTEYISRQQFQDTCGTEAPAAPRKVSVMSSRGEQTVSGTAVGRSGHVTGDETGSCLSITGTQYYNTSSFGALCDLSGTKKVSQMQTLAGRGFTGTDVGRGSKVTGDEAGNGKPVTGTEYMTLRAVTPSGAPVVSTPKVSVDQTFRGQEVTGTYVGHSQHVTGADAGACLAISGTPYLGQTQFGRFCEPAALAAQAKAVPAVGVMSARAITGDRPGAGGSVMTGDERGACGAVSGTPYIGVDNMPSQCPPRSGRFIPRGPTQPAPAQGDAPSGFSIVPPARAAQLSAAAAPTGTAMGTERITGPGNKATGLITGTPEFRHREASAPAFLSQAPAPVAPAAGRLTGEGSQAGRAITGNSWNAMGRVTGTEGKSSAARNLSERGRPRSMAMGVMAARDAERPAVASSPVTGASGNTGKGSLVTLSGGARA